MELMQWMHFSVVGDADGGEVNSRPSSREVLVEGRCYVTNHSKNRETLTNKNQTYKTAQLWWTKSSQKNTVYEKTIFIFLRRRFNSDIDEE